MSIYKKYLDLMRWSFSRVHGFEICKYEWYLKYIEERDKEENFYVSFGKYIHSILENIFTKKIKLKDSVQYYIDNFDETVVIDVSDSIAQKYFDIGLKYFTILDIDSLDKYKILGVEKECIFKIQDFNFVGYIDLLLRHKETNEIIIIDHKTVEYPFTKKGLLKKSKVQFFEDYKKQLYLYCQSVFDEYGVYPSYICLNYIRDNKVFTIPFVKSDFERAKKWVRNTINKIYKEESFPSNLQYFYCHVLCGFKSTCEYKTMEENRM